MVDSVFRTYIYLSCKESFIIRRHKDYGENIRSQYRWYKVLRTLFTDYNPRSASINPTINIYEYLYIRIFHSLFFPVLILCPANTSINVMTVNIFWFLIDIAFSELLWFDVKVINDSTETMTHLTTLHLCCSSHSHKDTSTIYSMTSKFHAYSPTNRELIVSVRYNIIKTASVCLVVRTESKTGTDTHASSR